VGQQTCSPHGTHKKKKKKRPANGKERWNREKAAETEMKKKVRYAPHLKHCHKGLRQTLRTRVQRE
jgi:hypothetical protein